VEAGVGRNAFHLEGERQNEPSPENEVEGQATEQR